MQQKIKAIGDKPPIAFIFSYHIAKRAYTRQSHRKFSPMRHQNCIFILFFIFLFLIDANL